MDAGLAAVLGALVGAVSTIGVAIVNMWARKRSQESEASDRLSERETAERTRLQDLEIAAQLRSEDRQHSEDAALHERGDVESKFVLALLAELQGYFSIQPQSDHGTYSFNADLTRKIRYQLLLVPDADLRDLVEISLTIINEIWVIEQVGELRESGQQVQRTKLNAAMKAVGAHITHEEWDRAQIESLRSIKSDLIDPAHDEYFKRE